VFINNFFSDKTSTIYQLSTKQYKTANTNRKCTTKFMLLPGIKNLLPDQRLHFTYFKGLVIANILQIKSQIPSKYEVIQEHRTGGTIYARMQICFKESKF
jgi:hypothetical protein